MSGFSIEESRKEYNAKIKVIGVGGGGGNMINHIVREGINELPGMKTVSLVAANTDMQALNASLATSTIQLGAKKTRGLGAGMKPIVGKESAEESYDEIKTVLEGANMVFISSGFGGGTGTGAAPIVAKAAKEVGALTVAVVTTPFSFEGKKRMRLALEGIEELKKECDSIVVIPNDKLSGIIDRSMGAKDSFKIVDQVLAKSVSGMSSIILESGDGDINLDFADVTTVMEHRGLALMVTGEAECEEGAAQEAFKNAVQSPLLENIDIKGAMGVLVNFKYNPAYPFVQIQEAMNLIQEEDDEGEMDIFFGTITDESMPKNKVEITIIATGFEEKAELNSGKMKDFTEISKQKDDIFKGYIRRVSNGDIDTASLDLPSTFRNRQD